MPNERSCKRAGIDCECLVRSEHVPEPIDITQRHCTVQHGVEVSAEDLRELPVEV